MTDNYHIKPGYRERSDVNQTLDVNRNDKYWTKERVATGAAYQWYVYQFAQSLIESKSDSCVLDIGCGSGYKLFHILGQCTSGIIGVDQEDAIRYCEKAYRSGTWIVDNLESPQLKLANVDLIISSDVIEHLVDPDALLNMIRANASERTDIVLSTPDRDRLRGKQCIESPKEEHIREWNRDEFRSYLESRGFKIIKHFHQMPLRYSTSISRIFLGQLYRQWSQGRSFRYNQVVHCRLA